MLREAEVKFFLDASPRVRAERRYREIAATASVTLDEVEQDIIQRDKNDSTRAIAPLKPAQDAVIIDSSDKTVGEVVESMIAHIAAAARRFGANSWALRYPFCGRTAPPVACGRA